MPPQIALKINSLIMPSDFPSSTFQSVFDTVEVKTKTRPDIFEHFGGAMNAVSYRYLAAFEYGDLFNKALKESGTSPPATARYEQERVLFGFFSNGFSVFEATAYATFAIGAFVAAQHFPITTAKDQQRISPKTTMDAVGVAFPTEPIHQAWSSVSKDPSYIDWREVRNILTHRAAPGRTFFVGIGDEGELPDEWKIKNIALDENMTVSRLAELSRLVTALFTGMNDFCSQHL